MLRIIRTTTLNTLRADSAALEAVRQDLTQAKNEAATAADSASRAETVAGQQLRELAQVHADLIRTQRERDAARTERDQVEAAARQELEEIRADVARLRDAAADAETGESVRHAIAYGVLRNLVDDARTRGLELGRPFDLVAILLGFDTTPADKPA